MAQIFIQIAAGYGNGKHYDTLSRYDQVEAMRWNTMIDAVIIWAFSLPKLAIVALLRRILNYGKQYNSSTQCPSSLLRRHVFASSYI